MLNAWTVLGALYIWKVLARQSLPKESALRYLNSPQGALNVGMCSELVSGDIGVSLGNLKRLVYLASKLLQKP